MLAIVGPVVQGYAMGAQVVVSFFFNHGQTDSSFPGMIWGLSSFGVSMVLYIQMIT